MLQPEEEHGGHLHIISPLTGLLTFPQISPESRSDHFEDVTIRILVGEGPIKVEHDQLVLDVSRRRHRLSKAGVIDLERTNYDEQ